jgi:polysaccharide chain length determinant protein (PEP-CTERM system associated)
MLPGKTYTPDDILAIAKKRIWYVLLPLAVVSAGTAVWARQLPDVYQSETAILVVPQRVPESYVRSTVTTRIEDRLQAIQQQIMSRTRLERIIIDFDLYPEERKTAIMEDVVQRMRLYDIQTQVLRGDAFRISYKGKDPRTVARVTEELGTLFINENLQDRSRMAEGTNQFLEAQLEEAKLRLIEQEKKVEAYKLAHAGQLPSQLESNLQVLQNSQSQLQSAIQVVDRERDRQTRLERDIADLEQQLEDSGSLSATNAAADGDTPARQLEALRDALSALLLTKKDTHPDVRKMKAAIAKTEQKVNASVPTGQEAADTPVSADLRRLSPTQAARRRRLDDMKLELSLTKRNIENAEREQQRLRKDIASYQARNEAIPTRETEMTELLRDYGTMNRLYTDLLAKKEDSKMAANLENRQIGEQFKVIDPARIPERPFSPDRTRYNAMGAAAGLAIGLLLVALLEYRDKSFKTDGEVARVLALPVLAVVPMMQSAVEQKRAFRNQLVMGFGFGTTVLACAAVVAYTLVR